mmetsp:Transcript_50508/g.152151  ORF Transcript_50508/g.152151 Transcript_50508/m.152151 type:complete len:225 (+) Transcript_50508:248-922(+)
MEHPQCPSLVPDDAGTKISIPPLNSKRGQASIQSNASPCHCERFRRTVLPPRINCHGVGRVQRTNEGPIIESHAREAAPIIWRIFPKHLLLNFANPAHFVFGAVQGSPIEPWQRVRLRILQVRIYVHAEYRVQRFRCHACAPTAAAAARLKQLKGARARLERRETVRLRLWPHGVVNAIDRVRRELHLTARVYESGRIPRHALGLRPCPVKQDEKSLVADAPHI